MGIAGELNNDYERKQAAGGEQDERAEVARGMPESMSDSDREYVLATRRVLEGAFRTLDALSYTPTPTMVERKQSFDSYDSSL